VQPVKQVKGLDVLELETVEPSHRFWEQGQVNTFAAELRSMVCRGRGECVRREWMSLYVTLGCRTCKET